MRKMTTSPISHVGFSDESSWSSGRYRSIGLVTSPLEELGNLNDRLCTLLSESNIREFKWNDLRGAKQRFAAEKMCAFAVMMASEGRLRVDVLTWDTQDERHEVRQRDDMQNFVRMYYHLFRNVLRKRWPYNSVWALYPDEHTVIDWENLEEILEHVSAALDSNASLNHQGNAFNLKHEFNLEYIQQVDSTKVRLIQLADLFAGMASFSRSKFCEYRSWSELDSGQPQLFRLPEDPVTSSAASVDRFRILKFLDELCKDRKLGVSLHSDRGLKTYDPNNPINFWVYIPQHLDDKAPQKRNV